MTGNAGRLSSVLVINGKALCKRNNIDYYQRLTLESWFTILEQIPLNRSQQLHAPYKRLIDEIKQN